MPPARSGLTALGRLFDGLAAGVYVLDVDQRIVFANQVCADWLGIEVKELLGQKCVYGASEEADHGTLAAAALCPPPDIIAARQENAFLAGLGDKANSTVPVRYLYFNDEAGQLSAIIGLIHLGESETPALPEPQQLHLNLPALRAEWFNSGQADRFLGNSSAIRRVRAQMQLAKASRASVLVLVIGPDVATCESCARLIHYGDDMQSAPRIVPLECRLLGSELLISTIDALFRTSLPAGPNAPPAALVLNEIEHLSLEAQQELVGRLAQTPPAWRVMSTSLREIDPLVKEGLFREDLACRISTVTIEVPPLVQRVSDLPLLAQALLERMNTQADRQLGGFAPEALDMLAAHSWSGGFEELTHVVQSAALLARGPLVQAGDLPRELHQAAQTQRYPAAEQQPVDLDQLLAEIERRLIQQALEKARGNKTQAAELLGMNRPRFYRRLEQLGLADGPESETGANE